MARVDRRDPYVTNRLQANGPAPLARAVGPSPDRGRLRRFAGEQKSLALSRGAARAEVIQATEIPLGKPLRPEPGQPVSAHWPAAYPLDSFSRALDAFELGVFFALDAPPLPDPGHGPITDPGLADRYLALQELACFLESTAFYHGWHLSLALAEGHCRSLYCAGEKRCWAMVKGRACIHPYKARPTLSSMGVRARELARKRGWDVPGQGQAHLAGLVLLG
ncbi:MAG: hypothetical protein JRI97_02695 [Deltaproteobacteria bacterium]|nr:hypothetical protein [Deltaproteobacteria bacterium]